MEICSTTEISVWPIVGGREKVTDKHRCQRKTHKDSRKSECDTFSVVRAEEERSLEEEKFTRITLIFIFCNKTENKKL